MCKYANRHTQLGSTQRTERVANNRASSGRGSTRCKTHSIVQQARKASRIRWWQLLLDARVLCLRMRSLTFLSLLEHFLPQVGQISLMFGTLHTVPQGSRPGTTIIMHIATQLILHWDDCVGGLAGSVPPGPCATLKSDSVGSLIPSIVNLQDWEVQPFFRYILHLHLGS